MKQNREKKNGKEKKRKKKKEKKNSPTVRATEQRELKKRQQWDRLYVGCNLGHTLLWAVRS
jgi:hypothetical protein